MKLEELITLYRAQSMDKQQSTGSASDVFCDDELLTIYANEGQDEACRRGQLLRDSLSPLCTVAFAADAEAVALDTRVIKVLRAHIDGRSVGIMDVEQMDEAAPGWQYRDATGQPSRLISGLTTGTLHLWPRPDKAGSLRLTVQRLPLKPMKVDADKPEIRPELHAGLVDWMLYRAYSREDTDLHSDAKAAIALRRFEAEFGRKVSGRNEEWVRSGGGSSLPGPIA